MEGAALLLVALLAIVMLELITPASRETDDAICVICGPHAAADAILHLMLFLPVGAALALLGTRRRFALPAAAGIAVVIELLQLTLPVGRVASAADLAFSIAGAAIGLHLTRRRRMLLYPRSRVALEYAAFAALAWLLLLLGTGVLLRPSNPNGPYTGEWRPALAGVKPPVSRVIWASVGGVAVPDGPVGESAALSSTLEPGLQTVLQAEFRAADPGGLSGILRVFGERDRELLLVAQRRHDLLFRSRMLATELRLVTPPVVMADALQGINPAEPRLIAIEGRRERGALVLAAFGRQRVLPLHSGLGWMFLVRPSNPLLRTPIVGSAVWIGIPLFIIGYWTGRRARRKARRAGDAFRLTGTGGQVLAALPVLALLVVVGLAGISLALGLAVPDESVWVAAAVALGLGMAGGIWTALSHDDRAHGVSTVVGRSDSLAEASSASGA